MLEFLKYPVSSKIGPRWGKTHKGTDYAVPVGTRIQATTGGKVTRVDTNPNNSSGYGINVRVQDANGNTHIYAHLSQADVKVGDTINAGELLGLSGNTGRSTGPHLHYEVRSSSGTILDGDKLARSISDSIGQTDSDNITKTTTDSDSGKKLDILGKLFLFAVVAIILFFMVFFLLKAISTESNIGGFKHGRRNRLPKKPSHNPK